MKDRENSVPPAMPAEDEGQLVSRIAALLATGPDESALTSALRGLAREINGDAWLLGWDSVNRKAGWLPPDRPGPIPLELLASQDSLLGKCVTRGRTALIAEAAEASESPEGSHLLRAGGGAWAFLPLATGDQVTGCLVLREGGSREEGSRLPSAATCAPLLALFLRATLPQRQLESLVEERTQEISLLYDVSRSLGYVLGPDDLFHLVGSSLRRALPLDIFSFLLLVPEHRQHSIQLSSPAEEKTISRFTRMALEEMERLLGRKPGKVPASVEPAAHLPGQTRLRPDDLRSVAHVPLFIRGEAVGLLSIASREPSAFGEGQTRLMFTIANQASLTLDRIRTAGEAEASKIRSMLESMAEGVILLDRDLRIVMSNRAACSYLGVLTRGRAPRTLERLGETDFRSLLDAMGRGGAGARTFEVPVPAEGRIFSLTCSPVRALGESSKGMVVVISDVTEARALQAQLAQNERLSSLGEMISGVAHELNNPLASVMGFAQLLLEKEVAPDGIRRKVQTINDEATRCQRIVQNLLRFARRHTPERRLIDLNDAVDSVVQLLGHQLRIDDVRVETHFQRNVTPVLGDVHLLQQVFLNIIINAWQAMREKPGQGVLRVTTRCVDGRVTVEIADNGPGIASKNIKRIFDPFFSTKEVGKGTGLGLSLAYGTVKDHGGTITAKSQPGQGAVFTISLPEAPRDMVETAAQAVLTFGEPAPSAPRIPPAGLPEASPPRRILVVEDETALAEVLVEVLQTHGHQVESVGDGRSAWGLIERNRYDLIISDLKMPQMNGRDLYRHVAATDPLLARRIIFSTGDTASPDTQEFFEEVGNHFLSKPFNLTELMRVVDSVLSGQ